MNEKELIIKCQKGNKEAYSYFVNHYKRRAYFIAFGFVGSKDDAYDLSQDAFIKAFKHLKKFDTNKRFFTWFYKILKNNCLNFIRNRKDNFISDELFINQISSEYEAQPDIHNEKLEMQRFLWQSIETLNPELKEIILLKEFEEMTYKDISKLLEIPIGTVMSRLYSARKMLKNKMEEVYYD
jgi:RNA polymerase sigma-70 factor, ECF subfamily